MSQRLNGKVAMVTGGGNGIGRAVCEVFAREGARVAVLDIDESSAYETLKLLKGSNHCVIKANVSKSENAKRAFEVAKEKLGGVCDILVNNAGIAGKQVPISEKEETDFDKVIQVNLKGVFLMAKEFLKRVKDVDKEVRGALINMSSLAGKLGFRDNAEYAASKAGVIGLTKSIAREFSAHKVRCNAVLPGSTETTILDKIKPEILDKVREGIPMKRFARPEEVANVVLFLASEESSYVHGCCMEVGGGHGM